MRTLSWFDIGLFGLVALVGLGLLSQSAARADETHVQDLMERAGRYSDAQDYDRAIGLYNEVLRITPNSAEAYNSRGYAYYYKGGGDAIADYTRAIGLRPGYATAFNNLPWLSMMIIYGVFVPNTWRRTLQVVGAMALLLVTADLCAWAPHVTDGTRVSYTAVLGTALTLLIGITVANLADELPLQLHLPLDPDDAAELDATLDEIRDRFGTDAVTRGMLVGRRRHLTMPLLPD